MTMYMNTRANLEYWSTDNCCLHWSLRTGSITIGFLSLAWQSLMVIAGMMMLVRCPVIIDTNTTAITNITNLSLIDGPFTGDLLVDGAGEVVLGARNLDKQDIEDSDGYVKCVSSQSDDDKNSVQANDVETGNTTNNGNNSVSHDHSSKNTFEWSNSTSNFTCPWLPGPETEVLGVHTEEKLVLVASIFIAYSGIYCILSLCVVIGSFTTSVGLLQGWVAFTGFHNMLVLASLLVPLPFTTLMHLFLSIAYFIFSLYTWAVVKSYMHALKVQMNKPLLPEGSITDYTVDGVDVTEITVQV